MTSRSDWQQAPSLLLDTITQNVDIEIAGRPVDTVQLGAGVVRGVVESEDLPEGRLLARKRIANAGVVLSKQVGTQRTDGGEAVVWKVIAYLKTDDLGTFEFNLLPDGVYRIQIQYPGVPMDPNAPAVELELTEGYDNEAIVEARIEESGFLVERLDQSPILKSGEQGAFFSIYPNPSSGQVEVLLWGADAQASLALYDALGKRCGYWAASGERLSLELAALPPGWYLLHLSTASGRPQTHKLLLQP
ncbi:MAG: T9SS type A sorting domain-containing protein [Cytophagales bacterium]|nr:T9SS type A sorting domain-containing protein [Cytophagales bacterium]